MRDFLRTAGLIVLTCAVAGVAAANEYFPQSVASGDPTATSVVLWTRAVTPDGGIPTRVDLSVATDQAMTNVMVFSHDRCGYGVRRRGQGQGGWPYAV